MNKRGRPAWWTAGRDSELTARWEAGESLDTIAAAMGKTRWAIRSRKDLLGLRRLAGGDALHVGAVEAAALADQGRGGRINRRELLILDHAVDRLWATT